MKSRYLPLTLPVLLGSIGFIFVCPARAQNPASPGGVTIIHPTDNGYDDLVAACDAIADAPSSDSAPPVNVFSRAQQPDATLADKRAAVRDPRFRQALALLHAAQSKPVLQPPVLTYRETLPMHAGFRNLSHLLPVLEYVQLADGSTASALDTLEEQIALGNAMQRWEFLSLLLGQSVIALGVTPVSEHLDRLSAGDCARLFDLLRAELNAPNPVMDGLHAESVRGAADFRAALKTLESPAEGATSAVGNGEGEAAVVAYGLNAAEVKEVGLLQKQKGAALNAFTENVEHRIASLNEAAVAANLDPSAPATIRVPPANETDAIAEKMAYFFSPKAVNVGRILDHAAVSRAGLQLLAIGAAITRYRWEHNALPESLAPLKLGTLATDPFTQGMIVYVRSPDGKQYSLSCAGPLLRNDDNAVLPNGKRKPVTLP